MVKTWTKADIQHKRLRSGDRYEDTKYEAKKGRNILTTYSRCLVSAGIKIQLVGPTRFQYKLTFLGIKQDYSIDENTKVQY